MNLGKSFCSCYANILGERLHFLIFHRQAETRICVEFETKEFDIIDDVSVLAFSGSFS